MHEKGTGYCACGAVRHYISTGLPESRDTSLYVEDVGLDHSRDRFGYRKEPQSYYSTGIGRPKARRTPGRRGIHFIRAGLPGEIVLKNSRNDQRDVAWKARLVSVPLDTRSPPAATPKKQEQSAGDRWWTPKPDWTRRRYEQAIRHAIAFECDDKCSAIDGAYLRTEHAAQGDNKQSWEAYCEYIRLLCNKGGSLANLKALAAEHPDSAGTLEQLAKGFAWYDDHYKAAHTFEAAAAKSSSDAQAICLMGRAAGQYAMAAAPTTVFEVVRRMKLRAGPAVDRELQVLRALCELADLANQQEATIALMERIVEIDPDDNGTRFNVAYKHSERGNNDLALFHYLKIPQLARDAAAWNNLGVSFQHIGLPASSVGAHRRAELLGNTLAMSNLAQKLMSAGFLSEARELCESALKIEDCHQNAASTLAEVKGIPDEENKKQAQALEKARPISEFYRECGRAMSQLEPSGIATDWQGPDCHLKATLDGGMFKAVGVYEQIGFAGLLSPFVPFSRPREPDRFHVEYTGTLRGRAIEGTVTRIQEESPTKVPSLLSTVDQEMRVLMVLTDDAAELRVIEMPEGRAPRLYVLKRKDGSS
jgi:tetratricopeptide (TPR) repeat protein